jgi:hypothetical protein
MCDIVILQEIIRLLDYDPVTIGIDKKELRRLIIIYTSKSYLYT